MLNRNQELTALAHIFTSVDIQNAVQSGLSATEKKRRAANKPLITVSGHDSWADFQRGRVNIAKMPATPTGRLIALGLLYHEILGHFVYTEGDKAPGALGDMTNCLEDISIERRVMLNRPGTRFDLESVTNHYLSKGSFEPQDISQALMGKAMGYGRGRILNQTAALELEAACDEMLDDAFGSEFIADIELVLNKLGVITTTKQAETMAQTLLDMLIQAAQKPQPLSPQQQQQQGQDDDQSQSGSSPDSDDDQDGDEQDQQDGSGNGNGGQDDDSDDQDQQEGQDQSQSASKSGSDDQQNQSGDQDDNQSQFTAGKTDSGDDDDNNQEDDQDDQSSSNGGNGHGNGQGGTHPTPEEIAEMLSKSTGYGDISKLIQEELNQMADDTPSSVLAGTPELPEIGILRSTYGKLDEVEAIACSSKMRAGLHQKLQAIKSKPVTFGCNGRKLAVNRLVKMKTEGDAKIFNKKTEVKSVNTAFVILLDESGSMQGSRYLVANPAAYALHHTLYGIQGLAICSMEFSTKDKGGADVNVLCDFGQKPNSEMFNILPFDTTPTAEALWAARYALLYRQEPRKIVLLLTDGDPDDWCATVAATARLLNDGIEVCAIGIQSDTVKHFWPRNQVINQLSELPQAMFGVVEDLLLRGV